jgi:adenosylhomocysteine nucleosidase
MILCPIPKRLSDIKGRAQPPTLELETPLGGHLLVVLVGLAFEARIAAHPSVFVICRDTEEGVAASLDFAVKRGYRSYISFGVAGGLAPHLRPGDWIVASSIIDAQHSRPTDRAWSEKMLELIPEASHVPILGVDTAITDPKAKQQMHVKTGAAAVDMESHHVARLALTHGLSFAAVRVVVDPAHRTVQAAALAGMRAGGRTSVTAVMRELVARPSQLFGLLRIAVDAYAARTALLRVRRMLGPDFGLLHLGKSDPASARIASGCDDLVTHLTSVVLGPKMGDGLIANSRSQY